MVRNIYISEEMEDVWEDIEAAALKERRGVGFFICEFFRKHQTQDKKDGKK